MASKNNNANANDNNNNSDFIASPKGTKPFPFRKKCRDYSEGKQDYFDHTPQEICRLLKIEEGDNFVYCDIESNKIISEKLAQ